MTLPPVPAGFTWTDESWGPALRCDHLLRIAPHAFTTRQLQLSAFGAPQLGRDQPVMAARDLVLLTQVHGNDVAVIRQGSAVPEDRPRADAVVSDAHGVAVAVRVADCVPLLIADAETGTVAAVHAGWRGTAARVASIAIQVMQRDLGARPEDLVVAIGPSIRRCCYEVGSDVVDAFAAAGHERYLIDRWFTVPPSRPGSDRPKLRLDVASANRDQLILAGVSEANIHDCGLCTAMHLDVLTSYRIERDNSGRLFAMITRR